MHFWIYSRYPSWLKMANKEIINFKTSTMKSQTLVAFLMDSDKYLRKKWVPTPAASQEKNKETVLIAAWRPSQINTGKKMQKWKPFTKWKKKSLKKILQIQLVLDQDSAQWELTRSVAVLALGHQLKQYPTKKKHLSQKQRSLENLVPVLTKDILI